jgi:YgiT-type zinc finger domain-containing protein
MVSSDPEERADVKCSIVGCPGEYEECEIEQTIHQVRRIAVVDHVPAEACPVCGDILFAPKTVERLEALRQATEPPAEQVPLYHFHAADAG